MAMYANGKTGVITYTCETCEKIMTEEDHDFCDMCPDCRDEE